MTPPPAGGTDGPVLPALTGDTRVTLLPLSSRPFGEDEHIVGRMETGAFVALPPAGLRAVELLGQGQSLDGTRARLLAEYGEDVDVADFVTGLAQYGFLARIGHVPLPAPEPRRPSLPRLAPRHVRWSLHPVTAFLVCSLITVAAATAVLRPDTLPTYRTLLISEYGSVVLAVVFGGGWPLLFLHELAHLVTARAAGVPARVELGTRLQFLVAQTDMSGIELSPRRHRLTAYLAGIAVNLCLAALAVLAQPFTAPASAGRQFLDVLVLLAVLPLGFQCLVFLRTDLYFVLQDLTRCHDLHGDGRAHLRHHGRRLLRRKGRKSRKGGADAGPTALLPPRQRRAVRIYSVVLLVGTLLCLGGLVVITLPVELRLLADAVGRLGSGHGAADRADALCVLALLGGTQLLWAWTKWRHVRAARRLASAPQLASRRSASADSDPGSA
ncbi:hypothetical protein [Streptomyces cyaneofuscatus]|uniref:hypothetical protein n=1 Tax=Streptomyces cyaneofuscatus TaxID=66883 RepID=UPI0034308BB2